MNTPLNQKYIWPDGESCDNFVFTGHTKIAAATTTTTKAYIYHSVNVINLLASDL